MIKPIYLFDVIGAVGDSLCSEPAVRYGIKNLGDGVDVKILTNHPQIFRHLGKPMAMTTQELGIADKEFMHLFNRHEFLSPEGIRHHPLVQWAPPLLVSSMDFISMLMLRRTLPDEDRKITIKFNDTSEKIEQMTGCPLNELVLLHVGSAAADRIRLFPDGYADRIVGQLVTKGLKVALIGKVNTPVGACVKVQRQGVIDLVDKLEWDDFITIISKAKVLVTNDSSPVHVASMFDNWLVVLPTIRHPDRLIHPRNGHRYYKAYALYKKLVLDDSLDVPISHYLGNCDWTAQVPRLEEYLAEPSAVASFAEKAFNSDKSGVEAIGGIVC